MVARFRFYIRHSFNDLRVNGQRTVFALLCIAAGVAAIVSLQTLGVMVKDSLTSSLQESNGGDIQISPQANQDTSSAIAQQGLDLGIVETRGGNVIAMHNDLGTSFFTPAGLEQIRSWFTSNYPGTEVIYREVFVGGVGMMSPATISDPRTQAEQNLVTPYFVDAAVYPLYGARTSEDGKPLSELLREPTDIVISRNLADMLKARVGDTLSLSGSNAEFILRGIVPTDSEGSFVSVGNALFGYYYVDLSAAESFGTATLGIDRIFVKLADPAQLDAVEKRLSQQYPYLSTTTTAELKDQNTDVSDTINQMVMVMALVSLLIGGIGIVNTMQVVVSRRTTEVAVLKTLGLEGEQVTTLFLVEAVLMGIVGSVFGIGLGELAAYLAKGIAGTFVAQTLAFRLTLTPALTGFAVGVIVTAIFGFMPTLAAGQVRPNLVLRPNDAVIPQAGRARSLVALIFVMAAISLIAQPLIGSLLAARTVHLLAGVTGVMLGLLIGMLSVAGGLFSGWARSGIPLRILRWILLLIGLPLAGFVFAYVIPVTLILAVTFVLVGLLYALLWLLIWIVGRFFPTWRFVDLKVALRSMLATRQRGASTLLALVIGVFTLSLITMLAKAVSARFETMLTEEAGGNVLIFASGQGDTLQQVEDRLAQLDGVNSYAAIGTYNVELVSLEDVSKNEIVPYDELRKRTEAQEQAGFMGRGSRSLSRFMATIDAREVTSNLPDVSFYSGRQLTAADAGRPYLVITANQTTLAAGFEVGDKLTFRLKSSADPVEMTFEIVGMINRTGSRMPAQAMSPNYAPMDAFPAGLTPDSVKAVVDIDKSQIGALRRSMNEIPGVFVIESRLISDLINRVIKQFSSFPILVASLALVVGGIVIANSVALSTLERRREIGIMKAVGLQRERVLGMLLLENSLMGLIGGLIGVGIGAVVLLLLTTGMFGGQLSGFIPYLTALALMGLCVVIALLASILTAWGASGEKPLNVLRYE